MRVERNAKRARLIAFYLPQYHPIPENDLWWGKGFTEWTNVAKARPMFPGHYQPHVPSDLGFYDLRVPETREAQAELARLYGVEAFCYYHYRFACHRLLERPFMEVLQSGRPDFPFCLCWANMTWTGIWHGAPDRILIEQTYPGEDDHRAHFAALLPAFKDKRYLTVDGKPLFIIYLPQEIPDPTNTLGLWRKMAIDAGLNGLCILANTWDAAWDLPGLGFDGAVLHPPLHLHARSDRHAKSPPARKIRAWLEGKLGLPSVQNYERVLPGMLPGRLPNAHTFPTVVPNWDNTPRSGKNGLVLHGSTPSLFRQHLRHALDLVREHPAERRFVFLKSWNEWAEGNHVEPDLKFGRGYLEAIRDELAREPTESGLRERVPRVLISLVNWNGGAEIARCVAQLRAQTYPHTQVIVVDNGSTDGSIEALRRTDPGLIVLEHGENRGYSGGHNAALRYGMQEGFDYFWLLNYDTTLEPGTLAALVDTAENDRTIGAVSPVIYEAAQPERIQFRGSWMRPREFSIPTVRDKQQLHADEPGRGSHFLLWGTAMLVRREAIQAAGLLDERYFAYYEDFDLTDRIRKAGYRNCVSPAARIWHAGNPDIYDRPPYYVYYNVRNHYLFWSERRARKDWLRYWRCFTLRTLWFIADLKETSGPDRLDAVVCGFRDAWLGRYGRWDQRRRAPRWLYALATAHPYALLNLLEGRFSALFSGVVAHVHGKARPRQ